MCVCVIILILRVKNLRSLFKRSLLAYTFAIRLPLLKRKKTCYCQFTVRVRVSVKDSVSMLFTFNHSMQLEKTHGEKCPITKVCFSCTQPSVLSFVHLFIRH